MGKGSGTGRLTSIRVGLSRGLADQDRAALTANRSYEQMARRNYDNAQVRSLQDSIDVLNDREGGSEDADYARARRTIDSIAGQLRQEMNVVANGAMGPALTPGLRARFNKVASGLSALLRDQPGSTKLARAAARGYALVRKLGVHTNEPPMGRAMPYDETTGRGRE